MSRLRHLPASFLFFAFLAPLAAQDDPDLPPKFRDLISEQDYLRLRGDFISMLRGLPADPALRDAAIRQMKAASASVQAIQPSWTFIGPSPIPNGQTQTVTMPVSGRVTAIEIDSSNTSKVYVGTAQGGLYRSIDAGASWTQIFDAAQSQAIGALALAPSDHTILYVGTGEANLSGDSFAGVGLYRINNADTSPVLNGPINPIRNYTDASNNPQSVPVFQGRAIGRILVSPTDPATVFVGLSGGVIGQGGDAPFGGTIPPLSLRGLFRSTNATAATNAVAFTRIGVSTGGGCFDTPCTGNRNVSDMVFDSNDPNLLVVWLLGTTAAGDGGIYRSTNALSATPTFTQTFTTTVNNARAGFAGYKPAAGSSVIYAATGETSAGTSCANIGQAGALRVSSDGGATWSAKKTGGGGFCGGQCFYNIALDIIPGATPAQDTVWLAGNVRGGNSCQRLAAKSTDGGATFADLDSGLHADTHAVKIDPTNPNIIYHGDDGGIFKTTNGGVTWTSLNVTGFSATQFSGIALHPTSANFTLGGTQDNGTNLLASNGTVWTRVDFGDGGNTAIDQNAVNDVNVTLYHTYFNQTNNLIGFARVLSTACASDGKWAFKGRYGGTVDPTPNCDGSDTFNGINLTDNVNFYAPLVLGPGNPNPVYFGTDRLYRSPNKGDTAVLVSQAPLVSLAPNPGGVPLSAIAVSPQDDNFRIAGLNNGALFYTINGSSTLSVLDATGAGGVIPNVYVGRVTFDPNDKNTAYVALGGYLAGAAPSQSHVWKVKNLSTTPVKTPINSGLPDIPVNAFAVDPTNPGNLFAGTDIGIFASTDGGASWNPYGTGLPVVTTFGMGIPNGIQELRIATHGRGMWQIPIPVCTAEQVNNGMTVTASGFRVNRATGHWLQTLTIVNNGAAVSGPVNVALVGLTPGVTLTNNTSGTACTAPAGAPFVTAANGLAAGDSVVVNLDFLNPNAAVISYTTKVLAGSGTP